MALPIVNRPARNGRCALGWAPLHQINFSTNVVSARNDSTNSVQATSTLTTSFMTIGSVTADANGAFQYEDVNAGAFASRFYRISSP